MLLGLIAKGPELLLPVGPDQGTYGYVAERILAGGLPYVNAFDNKPPLTYYAHAAPLALLPPGVRWEQSCLPGPLFQPCGYLALQALDLAWTAATVVAIALVARQVTGGSGRAALLAAALAAFFLNVSQLSKEGPTPEKQLLLPMVLAYWFALRAGPLRYIVVAGVLAGTAFLFKQTAISIPLALGAWWLLDPSGRALIPRRIAAFSLGFAVPCALVAAFFAARGGLGAFWEAAFAYNVTQAGGGSIAEVVRGLWRGAWQVFSQSSAVLWLLAIGGALLAFSSPRTGRTHALLLCWAAADTLALFLGGSKFAQVYFVQLVPSYAVLGALALDALLRWTAGRPLARVYVGAVLLGVLLLSSPLQVAVTLRALNERLPVPGRAVASPEEVIAARLKADPVFAQERSLFVWGDGSQVYLLAGATAPSRYFHVFPLSQVFVRGAGFQTRRAEMLRAFDASPPAAVVVHPATLTDDLDGRDGFNLQTGFPDLARRLAERYRPIPDAFPAGWRAYLRTAA